MSTTSDGVTPLDLLRLAEAEFKRYNRHAECGDYEMFSSFRLAQQLVAEAADRLGQNVENLRLCAYLTAIRDGSADASRTWLRGMAESALRGDPILVGDMGSLRQLGGDQLQI